MRSVVLLSTDKAVYPVNAMGMSKALMEKTAQAFARNHPDSDMTVSVTRYGNVMYSRGSVIPAFIAQLKAGRAADGHRPAHDALPDVARGVGRPGQARVLPRGAGRPLRPEGAGRHRGRRWPWPSADCSAIEPEISHIGTRHGEKLHETLLTREEIAKADDQGDYFRVPLDDSWPAVREVLLARARRRSTRRRLLL